MLPETIFELPRSSVRHRFLKFHGFASSACKRNYINVLHSWASVKYWSAFEPAMLIQTSLQILQSLNVGNRPSLSCCRFWRPPPCLACHVLKESPVRKACRRLPCPDPVEKHQMYLNIGEEQFLWGGSNNAWVVVSKMFFFHPYLRK